MSEQKELKPCPFCGRKPYIQSRPVAQKKCIYAVKCNCGVLTHFMDRKYKAIEVWNKRAPDQKVSMALYDQEEIHHNCTVQILSNSVTGDVSIGWWPEDRNPYGEVNRNDDL